MTDAVNHPSHYGGADNPYEAIKVIEAWELGFNLGNTVKYISRAGKKGEILQDLKKAAWYLAREIGNLELAECLTPVQDDLVLEKLLASRRDVIVTFPDGHSVAGRVCLHGGPGKFCVQPYKDSCQAISDKAGQPLPGITVKEI